MHLPSALAGFLVGGAAAGLAAVAFGRSRVRALQARVAQLEAAEREAQEALAIDNADLRRRIEAVADAVLARSG